jgi:NAD(P)H-hydrate epimerase
MAPGDDPELGRHRDRSHGGPRLIPRPPPALALDAHKGDAGRILLFCGSADMPGAAVLAARSAQRAGAGLVTVACLDADLRTIVPVAAPEAVLLDPSGGLDGRADHVRVVGPGLGATPRTRELVLSLLADGFEGGWVLDADALNVIAGEIEVLAARRGPMVIAPHPGEAERLLGRRIPSDDAGRTATAQELSRRSRAVCCLKGHRTVVAEGERVYLNETGNPGMATAGAGDVLAGILAAYLAPCVLGDDSSWTPFDAAASAVHVHGLAGDLAAAEVGRRGLVASDLIRFLPSAQARLH